ncbi:MAG TPA: hypothetical protein PLU66_09130, partial [Trueperaceae bacterium]|nr:hypothetical protein [Trueperaceae bacterium]
MAPSLHDLAVVFGAFELRLRGSDGLDRLNVRRSTGRAHAATFRGPAGRAFLAASRGEYRATGLAGHLRPAERLAARY